MSLAVPTTTTAGQPRWLLLASLALNLFMAGIVVAVLLRLSGPEPAQDRSDAARIERVAVTLPPRDADKLRQEFSDRRVEVDNARAAYRAAQDKVRAALRAEPFQPEAMRAAATETRAARQILDQTLHALFLAAAANMTPAGRNKLADWPPGPKT